MSTSVYETVTNSIIQALEEGTAPWRKSWTNLKGASIGNLNGLPLRACGTPYSGINILVLWSAAHAKGYTLPHWFTYKQAAALGGQVRKGEKSTDVVYYSKLKIEDKLTKEEKCIPLLKTYKVFNVGQIDGLPEKYTTPSAPTETVREDLYTWITNVHAANDRLNASGADIQHGGNKAYYMPALDVVQLPLVVQFKSTEDYLATKAHELIHWTGNETRLNRTYGKRFGDEAYAVEELVAELGGAFLCAALGISDSPRDDHASYLASWLKVLKADKKAIFTAASAASKAADYVLKGEDTEGDPEGTKVEEIAA
jgi:antirestriction protein ArdC